MKRVLILSQPLHNNYGGLLQAFALQKVVKSLGFEVVTNKKKLQEKPKITVKKVIGYGINLAKRIVKTILGYKFLTEKQYKTVAQNTTKFVPKGVGLSDMAVMSPRPLKGSNCLMILPHPHG